VVKYYNAMVVFEEIPDEITIAINITNCPCKCQGCHSKFLWGDIGNELTNDELEKLIQDNLGITCVCFMGGDANPEEINKLSRFEFSYDNFFKDKNIDNIKDKSYYKLRIAQSIIRVVFSKEKYLYIDESSKTSKYFEYYFIKNLIDKDLEITQKKYGNDISIIFRKEDIFDDIIKYIYTYLMIV
jgi:hypothetical protein